MEKREPSYTAGGNAHWCNHYGKQHEDSSKKTKNRITVRSSNPTPGPEKTIIQKDTCTPMFIAALFTIAKIWKQPKCSPTDKWIKKRWYIYTMEYYSAIKRIK